MCRLAVPVFSLVLIAAFPVATLGDEAPPLEALWRLPAGVIDVSALPAGIASGSDGSVYVVEAGLNRVQKFDAEGRLLERWGAPPGESAALEKPFGVAVGPDDSVYVTEMGRAQVRRFDTHGAELGTWGGFGTGNGHFREPRGIAVDPVGHVYVVDGENHRVQCFSAEGRFLNAWGGSALVSPVDIAVMASGELLVTDVGCRCVHRFTAHGASRGEWRPTDGFSAYSFWPQSVTVGMDGTIFVADPWAGQIIEFSSEGRFVARWPDPETGARSFGIVPAQGTSEGVPTVLNPAQVENNAELKTPLALDVDKDQRLLVLDRGLAQVRIYKP